MLYRGFGASHSPNVPLIDLELAKGLERLGFNGKRNRGEATFTSTEMKQAREYALTDDDLFTAEPLMGSYVTFVKGVGDLVLDFHAFLRYVYANEIPGASKSMGPFLTDLQGDIHLVETYLSLNRQKKNVALLVDAYLSTLDISEVQVDLDFDLDTFLKGHKGEVCITGNCDLTPCNEPASSFTM